MKQNWHNLKNILTKLRVIKKTLRVFMLTEVSKQDMIDRFGHFFVLRYVSNREETRARPPDWEKDIGDPDRGWEPNPPREIVVL